MAMASSSSSVGDGACVDGDSGSLTDIAVEKLRRADRVLVFTGAGMSAESGIATFRGDGGMWSGLWGTVGMVYGATPIGWKVSPALTWSFFICDFLKPILNSGPHEGYHAITRLQERWNGRGAGEDGNDNPLFTISTMNVDGFHTMAGSTHVREVHGTVQRFICRNCGCEIPKPPPDTVSGQKFLSESWGDVPSCAEFGTDPRRCMNGTARPDCTLFGEGLPQEERRSVMKDIAKLSSRSVVLAIGTSSCVYPAASIPERCASKGAFVIEINPESTSLSDVADLAIRDGAKAVLTTLADKLCCKRVA